MDLYRYFHPHHNPRLRNTPIRSQELGELQQATIELKNAVKRAEVRAEQAPVGQLHPDHFREIAKALDYVIDSFELIMKNHPEDGEEILQQMVAERQDAPGWESWTRLVQQRLNALASGKGDFLTAINE